MNIAYPVLAVTAVALLLYALLASPSHRVLVEPPRHRPEGACDDAQHHQPIPVLTADRTVVGHICVHCMVKLVNHNQGLGWQPYTDDGRALRTWPDLTDRTIYVSARRARRLLAQGWTEVRR